MNHVTIIVAIQHVCMPTTTLHHGPIQALPEEYLPEEDSFYAFDPIPTDDAEELMTYELTIPYKERTRFEEILHKIGFPVSALKKVVSHAAVF